MPIQADNFTADGIINNKVEQKCTEAMDMHFHWLHDQVAQEQFRFYCQPCGMNFADFWMKHYSGAHHTHHARVPKTSQETCGAKKEAATDNWCSCKDVKPGPCTLQSEFASPGFADCY